MTVFFADETKKECRHGDGVGICQAAGRIGSVFEPQKIAPTPAELVCA
jgi:hypothetical protein